MAYETIIVDIEDHISVITLNRPDFLNALSNQLLEELCDALGEMQRNDKVRCIVLTGSEKAFAAGGAMKWYVGSYRKLDSESPVGFDAIYVIHTRSFWNHKVYCLFYFI